MTQIIRTTWREFDKMFNAAPKAALPFGINIAWRTELLAAHGLEPDESTSQIDWWTRIQGDRLVSLATRTTVGAWGGVLINLSDSSGTEQEALDWAEFVKRALDKLGRTDLIICIV
jgi:hypothetical protein